MKKHFSHSVLFLFLASALLLLSTEAFSQKTNPFSINTSPLPAPTGPVMDYAGVMDANTKQQLEQKIIAFRDSTNPRVELAVVIVATTGDRDIFDYSMAVARGWGIGSKETDNPSALLFIAINDRKYFTQVSKDLEDELPDGVVGNLQRQYLVPQFKQQNYSKGVSDCVEQYIKTIQSGSNGEPAATETPEQKRGDSSSGGISGKMTCLIILFVLLILIFGRSGGGGGGRRNRWRGGGFGGSALPWVIGSVLSSGSSSSSSGWGGGSSDSGGSSWGGFGGGGDFGGGGAGGDW